MAELQYTADILYEAIRTGNTKRQNLLARKADYTEREYQQAYDDTWDQVKRIVEAQPDLVNEKYPTDVTLLEWIVPERDAPPDLVLKCVKSAKEETVDYKEPLSDRYILHDLADHGYAEALGCALGISDRHVNSQTDSGETPLHLLLRGNHSFIVHRDATKALLDYGADTSIKKVNLRRNDGRTPVDEYKQNKCGKYDNTDKEKQKKQLLEILHKRKMIPVEIRAHGPNALEAFNKALEEGETVVNQGRNIFMGLEGVGKTSTINSFLEKDSDQQANTDAIVTTKVCIQAHDELNWREIACEDRGRPPSDDDFIMNIWDFGGQPIYHTIQRFFCVSFAVACVVFNLEDDLDAPAKVRDPTTGKPYEHRMTNLQFVLYCINSIFTNSRNSTLGDGQLSPPVLLIGTHLDRLEGNEEEQKNKAKEIFSKIRQAMKGKPYEAIVFSNYFAIENSLPFAKSCVSNVMNQILKFAKKMVCRLPSKWLHVQEKIQKLKEENIHLPTAEVFDLVDQWGVNHDAQRRVLLEYLHDIGEILYFPDDDALKNIIVLNLIRMFDMFTTIINDVIPKDLELRIARRKLELGILEKGLFTQLWEKFNVLDKLDFFVSLMQEFGLVCKKKTQGDTRIFYVLSRLKPTNREDPPNAGNYGKSAVSIFHDFGGYLPDDLFQREVTKFIEKFQVEDSEPTLAYEHVELDIDELHRVVLDVVTIKNRRMFQTTIKNTDSPEETEPLPNVCKQVRSFQDSRFKTICQSDIRGVELTIYIPCVCRPNAHMHILRKFDKDMLPCGSNGMEVARHCRLFGDNGPQQALSQSQPTVPKPGFVDDLSIAKVSDGMDHRWRRFGVRLGFKWSEVNSFNAGEEQIRKSVENMLNNWRSNINSEQDQLKVLCTALRQHEFKRLAKDLSEGYISDNKIFIKRTEKEHFDDQDLLFICDRLKVDWRELGERLGFEQTKLDAIAHNNSLIKDCIMEVLVTWRDGQPTNQIPSMLKALRPYDPLAESVCERHCYTESGAPLDIGYYAKNVGLVVGAVFSFVLFVLVFVIEDEESQEIVTKVLSVVSFLATIVPLFISYRKNIFTAHNNRQPRYRPVSQII